MKMLTMIDTRWALVAPLGLLIASCGGGGGGGSGLPISPPGNDGPSVGGACDNAYYQEIIGTYKGTILYEIVGSTVPLLRSCRWEITARVEVERELALCSLRLDTESTVDQDIVLASDNPQRYQCQVEQGVRNLYDPNQSSNPSRFDDVTFPVFMGVEGNLREPRRGPYFDDTATDAEYLYLFDGIAEISDGIRFDGSGGMELFQTSSSSVEDGFSGTLVKEQ